MEDWYDYAKCFGMDPGRFFPVLPGAGRWSGTIDDLEQKVAKEICLADPVCPVLKDCLMTAIQQREYGVWGGTSTEQRVKLRRRASKL